MSAIRTRVHIDAPPERVFAVASDFAGAARIIEGIERVEMLTEGPVGVGTRFRETRVMFGREATEEMEVVAFDPPRGYVLGCENHGCRYRSEIRVEPSGDGTDVEMSFEAVPLTAVAKLMSVVMGPMMKKMEAICAKDLADLKRAVERND